MLNASMEGEVTEERIPSNATISNILSTLSNPDRFVAHALDVMRQTEKQRSSACVMRLGVTGGGVLPNFRVDAADGTWTAGAFDGVSFKSFPLGSDDGNWSTRSLATNEVEAILASLRPTSRKANVHRA
jgi:hypothetical protein